MLAGSPTTAEEKTHSAWIASTRVTETTSMSVEGNGGGALCDRPLR
jgi:hypothetical protein